MVKFWCGNIEGISDIGLPRTVPMTTRYGRIEAMENIVAKCELATPVSYLRRCVFWRITFKYEGRLYIYSHLELYYWPTSHSTTKLFADQEM
jgi:hypothetical protein